MKKVVCILVDGDFLMSDIELMERGNHVIVGGKVKSIFYGEGEFDKTMKLAQDMEEFIEAGNTVNEEEEYQQMAHAITS